MLLKRLFELRNSVVDFGVSAVELLYSNCVVSLRLFKVEFKFLHFTLFFLLLVLLPVFDTFLLPFLHKTGVALQFVYLNAP